MNRLFIILIAIAAVSPLAWRHFHSTTGTPTGITETVTKKKNEKAALAVRLQSFAGRLQDYAAKNGYNTRYCFLVDMTIACGSNRFFVYDIKNDSVLQSGLVTHGYGNSNYSHTSFSNVPGSNSSSLGKYKIGNSYNGKFGLAYKLHGLDKTNSKAFERFVVLHAHDCVPAAEVAPQPICMSQGCPTVAPSFLTTLSQYIDGAEKPLLLWIFN